MSTTATETQNNAPEITILTRFGSIPLVSGSLDTINKALTTNSYTRTPYITAKELSLTAYKYTEPIQVRLAPLIVRADGIANKAVDVVEARYPYPFKAKPEEVVTYVRDRRQSVTDYYNGTVDGVTKVVDERVRSPAVQAAQGLDQRFAPIVNYIEQRLGNSSEAGPSNPDTKYQYQRALALSQTVKDNIYTYSAEQIKQLQAQSVLAQRATETAQSITTLASSSISSAQSRIHALSDNMVSELQKLQSSTASFASSFQTTLQSSASQLHAIQPQIQQTYSDLATSLTSTANELANIIKQKDLPVQEKVSRVSKEVRDSVTPVLEAVKKGVSELLARGKSQVPESSKPTDKNQASGSKPTTNGINGPNGHASEAE
ncbi:hypothetical protein K443DRAFT_675376 [Laccaria amethystina LaAM-08-1]|uniref:Lipid droplet-associated perilipin protein n=1 Tax=Laccaria amethystina LaAM-08-1 TaxID=1095629 RepID=A0A0C9YAM7_9AGAR|nr:hypothetical protein K443DRAFT_675376 [Laccaria amethystina LaAM-08-1]